MSSKRTYFSWDHLLSRPGLSHIATRIFTSVDAETLTSAEKVCQSWRDLISASIWKEKFMKSGHFGHGIVKQVADLSLDKEELAKVCRGLCRNEAWVGKSTPPGNWGSKVYGPLGHFGEEGKYLWGSGRTLKCARLVFKGEDTSVGSPFVEVKFNLSAGDRITSTDVTSNGQMAAVGTDAGRVFLWNINAAILAGEGRADSRVNSIKCHPSGNVVATVHAKPSSINVWRLDTEGRLLFSQRLDLWTTQVDLGCKCLVVHGWASASQIKKVFLSNSKGVYVEKFQLTTHYYMSDLVVLESEPGLAVTSDTKPSLKVWDLHKGELLSELPMDSVPKMMSECSETGTLVVLCHKDWHESPSSLAIMPTAGLRFGLAVAAHVPLPRLNLLKPHCRRSAGIVARKGKVFVVNEIPVAVPGAAQCEIQVLLAPAENGTGQSDNLLKEVVVFTEEYRSTLASAV